MWLCTPTIIIIFESMHARYHLSIVDRGATFKGNDATLDLDLSNLTSAC